MRGNELTGTATTVDDVELRWRAWLPARSPRALLFIVPGLFEHSARYRVAADFLSGLGYACWSIDLRGHGESGGRRVHVNHFDDYARDVEAGMRRAREQHPDTPAVLFGHSMGGVVAIRYALDRPEDLHGLVLSSPGLEPHPDSKPPAWLAALGRALSRVAPRFLIDADLDAELISRRPQVVEAYRADPLIGSKVSARWFTAYESARVDAMTRAPELRVPTLLLLAGADRLVDPTAAERWADATPGGSVLIHTWDDCYHELLNEEEGAEVIGEVEAWLDEHIP
ncbi:MAG: lysophospholipase, partial [Acidobacteriota bacterium]